VFTGERLSFFQLVCAWT